MKNFKQITWALALMTIVLLVVACQPKVPDTNKSRIIDVNSFKINLPEGWTYNKLQGIDSQVGEFIGDGIRLTFDYGWYSDPLANDDDQNYVVTYETVNDHKAKFVKPNSGKTGLTGIYFDNLENSNKLSVIGQELNEEQQNIAFGIFRTIRFK